MTHLLALLVALLFASTAGAFDFTDPTSTSAVWTSANVAQAEARLDAMDDCTAAQALSGAGANTAPTCRAVPTVVATDSVVVDPGSIGTQTCATAITDTATGALGTDVVSWSFAADPSAVTGYAPLTAGGIYLVVWPSSGQINVKVCNPTASSIDPGSVTLNWQVTR